MGSFKIIITNPCLLFNLNSKKSLYFSSTIYFQSKNNPKIITSEKSSSTEEDIIKIENFTLFCDMQLAQIDDKKIQLTPIEFKFIQLLAKNPNKIFSRDYITNLLWPDVHVQNQNIDTHLSNLRKKLKPLFC